MKHYSFFDRATGIMHPQRFSCTDKSLLNANTPSGHLVAEGIYDPLSQRMDIATGNIIDYQPERPTPDHEWNDMKRRWQLSPAAEMIRAAKIRKEVEYANLINQQHTLVRTLVLNPSDDAARSALQSIHDKITKLASNES